MYTYPYLLAVLISKLTEGLLSITQGSRLGLQAGLQLLQQVLLCLQCKHI